MESSRQEAFRKLRPPCVELSAVGLKFRTKQVTVKDVLVALTTLYQALVSLGQQGSLDAKLAEYAFFPLTHVFNESQSLSSRCLETAIQCVTILVAQGWRNLLVPAMGKQLLLLMSLLSGADPRKQKEPPSEELKIAAFENIAVVTHALSATPASTSIFEDQASQNVIDQLVYQLLEALTESESDQVQLAASSTLAGLVVRIENRVFLASLLPRTVSSLTKALRPSTKARRTQKILTTNLNLLTDLLRKVLADQKAFDPKDKAESEALSISWLQATSSQIKNALVQVVKLRAQESTAVRESLETLCIMVIEECPKSLTESVPVMLETLVTLSDGDQHGRTSANIRHLLITNPDLLTMLRTSFSNWSQTLPRVMQGHDDKPKQSTLAKLSSSYQLLLEAGFAVGDLDTEWARVLVDGVSHALISSRKNVIDMELNEFGNEGSLTKGTGRERRKFNHVILDHQSQRDLQSQFQALFHHLRQSSGHGHIVRALINAFADAPEEQKLAPLWLATSLLRDDEANDIRLHMEDFLETTSAADQLTSRSNLLNDLYAFSFPLLTGDSGGRPEDEHDWRLVALSIEAVVMNAERYPGHEYRSELMDTLYPVLSFLDSRNTVLKSHAITALGRLATACGYVSVADMLIDNNDYLVNAVAWKLNTFALTPEAPKILQLMVRLCGARLIPFLDDLIQSIFAALDNFHDHPDWVELLFASLKAIVDEGARSPALAITNGKEEAKHENIHQPISAAKDILRDIRARKRRKIEFGRGADQPPSKAPHRPWTDKLDGPTFPKVESGPGDIDSLEEGDLPVTRQETDDGERPLSKSHQLLLSIANATAPHLASPSFRVRHLLLELVSDISPLLARDENTFLPFINSVWPVVVPRLFATPAENEGEGEVSFNICAAADTMSALCQGAGDFMSGRIEEIFAQLSSMFKKVNTQVQSMKKRSQAEPGRSTGNRKSVTGVADLQIAIKSPVRNELVAAEKRTVQPLSYLRTSSSQILQSLINLLTTILQYVRMSADRTDDVFALLVPFLSESGRGPQHDRIRAALQKSCGDALWLFDVRRQLRAAERSGQLRLDIGSGPILRSELTDNHARVYELDLEDV